MMRFSLPLLSLLCLPCFSTVVNRTVATVGKEVILQSDVEELSIQEAKAALPQQDPLSILVDRALLETACKKAGTYPTPAEIKQTINDVKKQNRLDDKGLENALRGMGTSLEAYEKQMYFELCKQKTIQDKIRGRINITKDDVRKAYERVYGDGAEFQLRLRDMVITPSTPRLSDRLEAKREAESIAESLRNGTSWDDVFADAQKKGVKVKSEKLGVLSRNDLVPSIADSVFSNSIEKYRGPVETEDGFHVLELLEKIQGAKIPLVDVEKDLHNQLVEKEVERLLRQYIEELRASTYVDIHSSTKIDSER